MDSTSKKRIAEYVQFLQKGRTMIARFRLPMKEDEAYELLMAAVIAEVQFRYRKFVYNNFIEDQLRLMAKWLTNITPQIWHRALWRMWQRQDYHAQSIAKPHKTFANPQANGNK